MNILYYININDFSLKNNFKLGGSENKFSGVKIYTSNDLMLINYLSLYIGDRIKITSKKP